MYKMKLQVLCQNNSWSLPSYSWSKNGPDHQPQFKASVVVNNVSFDTNSFFKSSKEAQNEVAKIAFEHLSPPFKVAPVSSSFSSPLPAPLPCSSSTTDVQYPYKSQLQNYTQKRNLTLPVYSFICEGPPHAPQFNAMVTVDDQTFESQDFCRTLREAEHAAAKVAFSSLSKAGIQEDDCALYKNLLQDLAWKEGFSNPVYTTTISGACHIPTFTSTLKVESEVFHGVAAKTKKQAEINAAKVAYFSIKERQLSGIRSPLSQSCDAQSLLSTVTVNFQQKLNLGCSSNSTPIIRSEDNRDAHLEADLSEIITNKVKANADHPTSSLKPRTGFERLSVPVPAPLLSPTECGSSSPTTVLEYTDLPTAEIELPCNRIQVYPHNSYMKFEGVGSCKLGLTKPIIELINCYKMLCSILCIVSLWPYYHN